jgi:hypothetical protein
MRVFDIVLVSLAVAGAAWVYHVKYDAEEDLKMLDRLQSQITTQEDAIDLLKAEWSLLNQPDRLQALADRFGEAMGLNSLNAEQMARPEELPSRPFHVPNFGADETSSYAAHGEADDTLTTGSIHR